VAQSLDSLRSLGILSAVEGRQTPLLQSNVPDTVVADTVGTAYPPTMSPDAATVGRQCYTCEQRKMSPTVLRYKKYRFFFFSREETRRHVHVVSPEGEAKFWLEPIVALAESFRLNARELKELQKVIERRNDEIIRAWNKHFTR